MTPARVHDLGNEPGEGGPSKHSFWIRRGRNPVPPRSLRGPPEPPRSPCRGRAARAASTKTTSTHPGPGPGLDGAKRGPMPVDLGGVPSSAGVDNTVGSNPALAHRRKRPATDSNQGTRRAAAVQVTHREDVRARLSPALAICAGPHAWDLGRAPHISANCGPQKLLVTRPPSAQSRAPPEPLPRMRRNPNSRSRPSL
jgi:hypothetical protein